MRIYIAPHIAFLCLLVQLCFPCDKALQGAETKADRPNILLILADNWRWPTAGVMGDPMAHTPAFDRIAREGVLFTHTFNPVPSCSPTRACLLTGKIAHQLGERASLWSAFPRDTPVITERLRKAGYQTGYCGKGWGPGNHAHNGWKENPAGPLYSNFAKFHQQRDKSQPFFFWLGNTDTATRGGQHPYLEFAQAKLDSSKIVVPPELPDCPDVRRDLLNYYGGVMKLDEQAAETIAWLERAGELDNTVVIYTSDNGWQLPRGLANCYDSGSRVPLAIRWGQQLVAGRRVDAFINVADLGPTILQLAGLTPPAEMSMRGFKELLRGEKDPHQREHIFIERERHANVRHDNLSYPIRAVRSRDFLYIRNLRSDRWPAGDPDVRYIHGRPFGDVDTTAIKDVLLANHKAPSFQKYIALVFDKRPAEELYDLQRDPSQLKNIADNATYMNELARHRALVDRWMKETGDPRVDPTYDGWDRYPYYGQPSRAKP